ncbi:MAG: DUF1622 domain-containing protein [Simkaniaceae bacterium]|nr:DUF1622 domain-containing protein [Candidatus Sacchlamyda saccharinae]
MEWIEHFFLIPDEATSLEIILLLIRKIVALIGVIIILWGAIVGIFQFLFQRKNHSKHFDSIDVIRLKFGRTIILGLEFIVAADVIATTTAPDYYSVGILASLVGIRTLLTYFMNKEMLALSKK